MNLENLRSAKNLVLQLISSHEIIEERSFANVVLTDDEGMAIMTARVAALEKQLRETGFVAAVKQVESLKIVQESAA